ncbi:hypothetical protein [Brevibacillus migulae]|nr:hypothetical protein [Brevibacillus migulae]
MKLRLLLFFYYVSVMLIWFWIASMILEAWERRKSRRKVTGENRSQA